ncbi:PAS domain-containing sensor histidine kinase [Sediminibacterium sp.]|uniref:PAS domain-containing sensor histidine kinase n=2 Tax=Sediminibacterium sp. TaxID=1917865 RepID=UPI002721D997|nr:PAS domain-containing sensor histidine kinase [Sediminibacterium sp.]MDO8996378.1 PAS domain S-box protein [Sediminibacterium sp.]MDP2420119.1 PAS domain S-box protein [Sediminibacterium sp.]
MDKDEEIEQLKKLNELFEESNRAAKIGVWELDIETNHIFWSNTTKVIHGVEPDYIPNLKEAYEFIKPGSNLELVQNHVNNAITNNIPYNIEMQIIRKDGAEIWTRARGTPEFKNGKCIRLFGTFQDIQDQKEKEIELINSELKMGAIFNNNIDALFLTSPIDGSILRANRAASELFGYTEQEFNQIGRNGIIDTSDPKLPELLEKRKREKHITTDLIGIKKNGERFPIRVSSGIFSDSQGNTQASTCIIDMTDIKNYQNQVEEIARKFKGIFHSTFQFIGFLTPDGTLTEANDSAIQFAGLQPADVIGKKFWDCHWWRISEQTRAELKANIERAAKGEFVQYEVEILGANNTTTTILFNLKPLFNERNEVYSIIPEGRLIQEIVDTRKELISKNNELSRFTTIVSHDLKEPLRMVSQFMNKLEQKYAGSLDDKARQYIFYAVDGARRMSKLIDELLNYSRISEKDKTFERINSLNLLDDVKQSLKQIILEKNVLVEISELPEIIAIKTAIRILFTNLITNSIKYSKSDIAPIIKIACIDDINYWQFSVSDNGIGINKEHHEMIFQLFSRLHSRVEYEGTGIGLATCKKIVELHHGKIWVDSELDKGSTFFFTIKKNIDA